MAVGRGEAARAGGGAEGQVPVHSGGVRPALLTRPRLLQAILGEETPRVTLLIAPSGYGKSVLLGQAGAQVPAHVAVDLRETGGQVDALVQALIAGIQALNPALAESLQETQEGDRLTPQRAAAMLASLPPTLLTVDHAERLGPDGEAWLLGLVRHLPAPHRALVAARTLSTFEVPYLVATGTAGRLGPEQLALQSEELAALGLRPEDQIGVCSGRAVPIMLYYGTDIFTL
ncbi:hypothetical protein [Deinococcus hopiensis]|nr:hypothetical protein [Deinococcus hopiensis]